MSIRNGLVFAMEDDNMVDDGEQKMVPELTAQVEAGSAQVVQQSGEVEDLQAAIEDAEAGAETLGKVEEVLEKTTDAGDGVDETAAQVAEIAVESIKNRLGIIGGKQFPAMESFGSKNTRLSATKLALENVIETIVRIWEAIKAALIRLWDKIRAFLNTLFKNIDGLAKQLEDLKERASKIPVSNKPKEAILENKDLAKSFSVAKKADASTAKTLIDNASKLMDTAKSLAEGSAFFSENIEKVASDASNTNNLTKARDEIAKYIATSIAGLSNLAASHGNVGENAEKSEKYYGPFVGTRVLAVTEHTQDLAGGKFLTFGMGITTYEKIQADKITALKANEVFDLAKEGLTLTTKLKEFEKSQKELEKAATSVRKSADKATASLNKSSEGGDPEIAKTLKSLTKDVATVNSLVSAAGVGIPNTIYATVKAVINYGSISLRNLAAN